MSSSECMAYVVDDDDSAREAIRELLESSGLVVRTFPSAAQYLESARCIMPACLILDIRLPDINGLALQQRIAAIGPPIIFLTGHGDIPSCVRAIKAGAVDFLTKPFSATDLLVAIHAALEQDRRHGQHRAELARLRLRFGSLTPREHEVLPLVASGLLNKQAAAELGIRESTLQIHRGNIMRKMEAASLSELVRMAAKLAVPLTHSRCAPTRIAEPAFPTDHFAGEHRDY
jgi:FixJ family two-component response regulator